MAGANGMSSKAGPTSAAASAPAPAATTGKVTQSAQRYQAALSRLADASTDVEVRAAWSEAKKLRGGRTAAMHSRSAGATKSAAPARSKPAAVAKAAKPVGKHGDIHVYADKGGSFRLVHATTGQDLGGGFSKGAAKSLGRHFGLERVKGVGNKNPGNAMFRKAMSGDAKAAKAVHSWLAEGRRRSAPKIAVVH